ncbi:putative nuclease HARBI1 [Stegodyphus dumicola]|uniref:putative nuclease HARBI1 n=1 Tax=Stegodyphus dumicola TaxID=202533 RepID=UPI0015AF81CD|nr:putative nuclease HARBI1 [Stegodyphus dumicola]
MPVDYVGDECPLAKEACDEEEKWRLYFVPYGFLHVVHNQQSIANEFCLQVSQPTASRAVSHVAAAINRKLLRKWIKFPKTSSTCPEHIFVNRHCSHSINVQMICDANQKIISCNAKFPGSTHDAFIWRTSAVRRIMQEISSAENTTWLLGDSGYPLEEGLLTPRLDSLENSPDQRYNVALCKTRNVIERCFGVLKSRFSVC